MLFSIFYSKDGLRYRRIHIQLMPELPRDNPLAKSMNRQLHKILIKYGDIIQAIVIRDKLKTRPGFKNSTDLIIKIGQSLFDGLMINSLSGMPVSELKKRMGAFIDLVITASFEGYVNIKSNQKYLKFVGAGSEPAPTVRDKFSD